MSKELVTREKKIVGGTIECCNFSMSYGVSMNIAGGTHHAFHNRGEAFCMLNDQAVAANVLINEINNVKIMLDELYKRNIQSVLVEGGGFTITHFLDSGFFDELHL